MICIDNLRADHVGLYGYARNTTPNFDKWAAQGQVFENFYSTTHMTIPSEGSVFTGRYPFENGLISFEHSLWPQVENIATILKKQGYKTLAYGNSFEYVSFPSVEASFRPLFDTYEIHHRLHNNRILSIDPIKKFLNGVGTDNFFIWLPVGALHSPFGLMFPNTFSDRDYGGPLKPFETFPGSNFWIYKDVLYPVTPETNFNFAKFNKTMVKDNLAKKQILNKKDLSWMIDRYDDGIYGFDQQFQEIMNLFDSRGLSKNTIFVVYSNHGEELNEHGYFGHFDIYEGNVHTPLVIKSPAIQQAKRNGFLASSVDILPTVLTMLELPFPPDLDGLNLFSAEAGQRESIFLLRTPLWESLLRLNGAPSIWDDFRTKIATEDYMEPVILTDHYKLIHRRARFIQKKYSAFQKTSGQLINFPEYEMYDLKTDPLEQHNQAFIAKNFSSLLEKLKPFEKRILNKKNNFLKAKTTIQDYQ